MNKQVFITYSWDSKEHKEWVKSLADSLISKGIMVFLDQYEISPGDSFTHFMEKSITKSDKVLVVLTPNYKEKSIERKGGVGYEQQIISGEIMSGMDRKKFIPLIRFGKYEEGDDCALPPHFKGISTLDFRSHESEQESFDELLRAIYEEPKLVKPNLGTKPNLKEQKQAKSFLIELDENFNSLHSEIYLTDLFLQISDLRKSNSKYNLTFNIKGISNEFTEYQRLVELANPSENEIERKLLLRSYLSGMFFLTNGTIYEYLSYSIDSIIDFSFNKHKYIFDHHELYSSLTKCLQLFSNKNNWSKNITKFDVFHNKINWMFSIWISKSEVNNLLSRFPTKDNNFLTSFAGLDLFDLSHLCLIEDVIPKESFQFTIDYFQDRVTEDIREECFRVSNWRIGLG